MRREDRVELETCLFPACQVERVQEGWRLTSCWYAQSRRGSRRHVYGGFVEAVEVGCWVRRRVLIFL